MLKLKDIQGPHTIRVSVPSTGNAASTGGAALGTVPFDATVTAVKFVPAAGVTGDATNKATVTLTNRGQAGAGSTAVAALTTTADMTAWSASAITVSATAANLLLTAGDNLSWDKTVAGTGVVIPAGVVEVTLQAR